MWLLADLFQDLPEEGDVDKPKLVFFFDEAHLLFNDASKAFLDAIEQTVRLIRSKGVGVFFVTQSPTDVPDVGAGSARLAGAAPAARAHTERGEGAARDRAHVSRLGVRPRGGADPARHRRGDRDGDERARCADAGRLDAVTGARGADGSEPDRDVHVGDRSLAAEAEVCRRGRSRLGPRDPDQAARRGSGQARGRRGGRSEAERTPARKPSPGPSRLVGRGPARRTTTGG